MKYIVAIDIGGTTLKTGIFSNSLSLVAASNKDKIRHYNGREEIEIIGTFVIPEFGTIVVLVLAIAIITIITITSKSRLSIMPKL